MYRISRFLFLFIFLPTYLQAQIFPKEGSQLNYRIIGFSFPGGEKAGSVKVEIAAGNYLIPDSFRKHIIKTVPGKSNKLIIEVPAFGQDYTWRYENTTGSLHHFKTGMAPNADTSKMRLRILKNTGKYKEGYVFPDGNAALYDMNGNPVWYLPSIGEPIDELHDLKLSDKATITFINGELAYEINYDGDILWKAPNSGKVSGDHEEYYHHEFTRLSNGHYMILGSEFAPANTASNGKTGGRKSDFAPIKMIQYGTIIEYDEAGNVIWSWKSSQYYKDQLLYYPLKPNGSQETETHENAFYFDEKDKIIYVSFKNANQVLKIKYPEGTVVKAYGKLYKPGDGENNLFCDQHSCKLSQKKYLMLFNNNRCNLEKTPKIEMFKEPASENESLKKIWEYETTSEVTSVSVPGQPYKTSGGNVIELADQSVFASMCSPYANIFVVDLDKKIQWNALPEKWSEANKQWEPVLQYRASIIADRRGLEYLIWGSQSNKKME